MSNKLLVVGSVAFDSLKTRAGKRDEILGGAATYIALTASHFAKVNLVGVVGKGDFPEEHVNLLTQKGVDVEGLEFAEGKTFRWAGEYADDFSTRQTLDTQLGVFEHFDPKIPDSYQGAQIVLLGNINPSVQLQVLDRLNEKPYVITDTMNLWMDIALDELKKVIARTNLLVINDEEAVQLSGELQIRVAAKKILAMGPEALIIKRGEHGAYLFTKDTMFFAPAIPLEEVIDPTGAGDSFVGGLAGYLAGEGKTTVSAIKKGMIFGTATASATCEGFGTENTARLTKDEVLNRYYMLLNLVSTD
ncbi:MAG: bifunctional hydroxymethylpyrimidine kinase/phosphomethylpyrimidine kinase [Deltaproteobacteria bacterium]|nr:bifunctional hydroxymethylpyrimidine kinase/phosphomethylpyrimidine kinase [Deltaproteobacteria bacterium]